LGRPDHYRSLSSLKPIITFWGVLRNTAQGQSSDLRGQLLHGSLAGRPQRPGQPYLQWAGRIKMQVPLREGDHDAGLGE